MQICKLVLSADAPNMKDAVWMKPVDGGFELYMQDGGWKPLKVTTPASKDTTKYAPLGKDSDSKETLSLYGLKAYVDDALENLG